MSTGQGYSITTYRFRLRCGHPEWLRRTQELYDGMVKFYYDLLLEHEELWEQSSQETLRSLEYLSLPGKEKRNPQSPLPWEDVPPYFRRAAINSGIAAAKSFLTRKNALADSEEEKRESVSSVLFPEEEKRESSSSVLFPEEEKRGNSSSASFPEEEKRGSSSAASFPGEKRESGSSISAPGKGPSEFHSAAVYYSRMYRDFSSDHITLKVWDGEKWSWLGCRLSRRNFPPEGRVLSPSVVEEGAFFMLHVPVREPVEEISPAKKRVREGGNICGVQFTNGDAFAVASVYGADGNEVAVRFFNGGREYRHHCERVLNKISRSLDSLGDSPEGPANKKYWMHLKHLREHYAHQVSREIVRFCEQNRAGVIVLPKYKSDYVWKVMKGAGNWSPLHLSFRIRSYLKYKAWQSGILVLEAYAVGTGTVCAGCGQPLIEEDGKSREFVCRMGHRGNRYLNTARNLAVKCRRQFLERESG